MNIEHPPTVKIFLTLEYHNMSATIDPQTIVLPSTTSSRQYPSLTVDTVRSTSTVSEIKSPKSPTSANTQDAYLMILSDVDPSQHTLDAFHIDSSRIRLFERSVFTGKNLHDFKSARYKLVYINLRREGAKEWCESQDLIHQTEYTILTLYKGTSDTTWLESLEGIAVKNVSMKLFNKMKSLTTEELFQKLMEFKDISVPPNPNCCYAFFRSIFSKDKDDSKK